MVAMDLMDENDELSNNVTETCPKTHKCHFDAQNEMGVCCPKLSTGRIFYRYPNF